jgi:hypothetical protein
MAATGATAAGEPTETGAAAVVAPPALSSVEAAFRMSADARHMNLAQARLACVPTPLPPRLLADVLLP